MKIIADVSGMEVPQSVLGVRTRAQTQALQHNSDLSYLQLRNRCIKKPPSPSKLDKKNCKKMGVDQGELDAQDETLEREKTGEIGMELHGNHVDVSFGDNDLENDATGRGTRESTSSSFIRELDSIGTPGSAVRSTSSGSAYQRPFQNPRERSISSVNDFDAFFANAEMQQMQHQVQFTTKYNFDIVNDLPLPGRYDWVRVYP